MLTKSRSTLTNSKVQAFAMVAAVLGLGASPSYATSTDPLDGGGDGIFTQLTAYLTGSLVAKVFALAVVSIAIGLVLKWVRKAVHA
jgi:hypothetical protein